METAFGAGLNKEYFFNRTLFVKKYRILLLFYRIIVTLWWKKKGLFKI